MCSTPHGVVAVCTRAVAARLQQRVVCSTPHGVVAVCTTPCSTASVLSRGCSTPHGVVAVCTPRCREYDAALPRAQRLTASLLSAPAGSAPPSSGPRCASAQRLTASLLSARPGRRPRRRPASVLNASRRRCCLHTTTIPCSSVPTPTCSTPHGVVAVCTPRCREYDAALPRAQRLTASLLSAPARGQAQFKRRGGCSTPHGVVAVCTTREV